jgi:outer membrane protein TolC
LALTPLAGCTKAYYRASADREVYGILEEKSPQVPGMVESFTIDQTEQDVLAGCPPAPETPAPAAVAAPEAAPDPAPEALAPAPVAVPEAAQGPAPEAPAPAPIAVPEAAQAPAEAGQEAEVVITLAKALEIATLNSRDYQTHKETLYRSALSLTAQRYEFDPHFFGTISGDFDYTRSDGEKQVSAGTDFGFGWLLATGARLSVSLASSFSEFLTGDPRKAASSLFSATVTQPLLQGAGISVTEPLTQAERDVIYEIRRFVRYRRTFFVQVLSAYYRVLQARRVLENERMNYDDLVLMRDRGEWMGQAGRIPEFQVDQIRQDVLRAEDSVLSALQDYQNQLDGFKITLGLPTGARVVLDPRELDQLTPERIAEVDLPLQQIEQIAEAHRLDLMTQRDGVEDAGRKLQVAENDLLPGLDLSASLGVPTEDNQPLDLDSHSMTASAGFELDLPLDKLSERNEYRRRLIDCARVRRDYTQLRDQVIQEVRNAWRQYGRAKHSYQIQQESVRLAERRMESTRLLLDAGRADARDVLEARSALVSAQNQLARALVDYKTASLELARDMDILQVGEKGELKEAFDEYRAETVGTPERRAG